MASQFGCQDAEASIRPWCDFLPSPDFSSVWSCLKGFGFWKWPCSNISKFPKLRGWHKMELSSDQPYPQLFPTTCYLDTLEWIIQKERRRRFNCYFAILMNKCHLCSSSIYFHNVRQSFHAKNDFHYQQKKRHFINTELLLLVYVLVGSCLWLSVEILTVFQTQEEGCHFRTNSHGSFGFCNFDVGTWEKVNFWSTKVWNFP